MAHLTAPAAGVAVRGNPTPEELAAVLAAVALRAGRTAPAGRPGAWRSGGDGYERWRRTRLAALGDWPT